jgi:hypothetical protein
MTWDSTNNPYSASKEGSTQSVFFLNRRGKKLCPNSLNKEKFTRKIKGF